MSIRAILQPLRFILLKHPKIQEVCERAVEKDPWQLKDYLITDHLISDHFKTEKMCERAVKCVKKILGA